MTLGRRRPVLLLLMLTTLLILLLILTLQVAALVSGTGMASSSLRRDSALPNLELAQIYTDIAQQAVQHTPDWPRNQQFVSLLQQDDKGHYVAPTFNDGLGPIGTYALLKDNAQAQTILRYALQMSMVQFVKAAKTLYGIPNDSVNKSPAESTYNDSNAWFAYQPKPESLHMCIVIFQEHFSLLKGHADMQAIWKPFPTEIMPKFVQTLTHSIRQEFTTGIPLRLHSIFWTPDGALIAGLVQDNSNSNSEDNDNNNEKSTSFAQLRKVCVSVAEEVLPIPLTTRPKKLIHVTLGRILEKPKTESAQESLTKLMQDFNRDELPQLTATIRTSAEFNFGRFDVEKVYLLREIVWMCNFYKELAVVNLVDGTSENK